MLDRLWNEDNTHKTALEMEQECIYDNELEMGVRRMDEECPDLEVRSHNWLYQFSY